nr:tetratricopeptide repeat protein [Arthrospira sp. SH-MAG29]
MGDALLQLERWDEAAQAYQNAIGLKDDFAWSHYNLGEALSKLQRWDEAIKAYKDAIEIKSDLPCIHEKLGDALRYQVPPNLEEISQAYEQAIQANPQDLQIYYRALEANPKDAKISLMLADAFRSQGQLDKAVTFYKSTLKIEPQNAEIHIKLGDILLIKGYQAEAIKHYQTAIKIEPNLSDIRYKLDELTANNQSVIYEHLDTTQVLQEEQLYISAKKNLLNQEYHQAIADCAQIMGLHQSIANIFPILVEAYTKQEKIKEAEFCLKNSQYIRQLIAYQQVINNWGAIITGDSDNAQPKSVATNDNHINKIIIYTCVWGRPELTRIVLSYYADIKRELSGKINLELLAVGSEGDASRKLCQECGFDYLEYPNQPLSSKWEYGLNRCADYDPDGVIIVGSDDIISQNLIEFYDEKLKDNLVFCGIQDAYFFDVSKQHLVLWMGYGGKADFARVGETIGMGRCLSRTLLDKLEFSIWKGLDINSSLDGAMTQKLEQLGLQLLEYDNCLVAQIDDKQLKIGHCGFKMAEIGACAVDIKFSNNITTIERYIERDANALVYQAEPWLMLEKYFPNGTVNKIKELVSQIVENKTISAPTLIKTDNQNWQEKYKELKQNLNTTKTSLKTVKEQYKNLKLQFKDLKHEKILLTTELSKIPSYRYGSLTPGIQEWQKKWDDSPGKRVLLYALRDYSGSFFKWAEAINKYTEFAARLVTFYPHKFQYELDLIMPMPNAFFPLKIDEITAETNIIHIKDETGFFTGDNGLESNLFTKFKKPMIFTHYGGYARKFKQNTAYIDYVKNFDARISMTPDLCFDWFDGYFIPHSIDIEKFPYSWEDGNKLSHSPSTAGRKGTSDLLQAIEGLSIEFDLISGVTHNECMKRKSSCTLFFDQAGREMENKLGIDTVIGWYGNSAIEAAVMGIPTIAHLSQDSFEGSRRSGKEIKSSCAIINTPMGTEGIRRTILDFINLSSEERKKLSLKTRKWIEDFHSYQVNAHELVEVYKSVL